MWCNLCQAGGVFLKDVIVIGAGGHAKTVVDTILHSGDRILGLFSETIEDTGFHALPVIGTPMDYKKYPNVYFIIAIGNAAARERIASQMIGAYWYTAIHPSAIISPMCTSIGEGTIVSANAVINPFSSVGKHCIINSCSLVEHDNSIGDFAHISVGARCAGGVSVGKSTWVGIGASVRDHISICDHCMIGARAVVVKNITEPGTYVGIPAKKKET